MSVDEIQKQQEQEYEREQEQDSDLFWNVSRVVIVFVDFPRRRASEMDYRIENSRFPSTVSNLAHLAN